MSVVIKYQYKLNNVKMVQSELFDVFKKEIPCEWHLELLSLFIVNKSSPIIDDISTNLTLFNQTCHMFHCISFHFSLVDLYQ